MVAGLLLLEGAGEDMWSHENSLYHSGLGRLRPEHDVWEGGILTRPACANTGGCCGVIFCRDYGTLRTGAWRHFLAAPGPLLIGCVTARARFDRGGGDERRAGTGRGAQIWDDGRARYSAVETSPTRSGAIACAFVVEGAKRSRTFWNMRTRVNDHKLPITRRKNMEWEDLEWTLQLFAY